jgi:hypothetical protein
VLDAHGSERHILDICRFGSTSSLIDLGEVDEEVGGISRRACKHDFELRP